MTRSELVQGDFSPLEVPLSRIKARTEETFDSEIDGFGSVKVDSEVDDTVSAETEDR